MNFLPVPKLLKWHHSLLQTYTCEQSILVTSGCSFTSTTLQLETAASWPGFVIDRCRFNHGIDYSYPGVGNDYIGDSILHHFKSVSDSEIDQYLVVVMWSGIDRVETKKYNDTEQPNLDGTYYHRHSSKEEIGLELIQAQKSYQKILEVYNYLCCRGIKFFFTSYANLLFPPYIPKRDTTKEFDHWLSNNELSTLRNLNWGPSDPMDYLYEYAFKNNYLEHSDMFHPTFKGNLEWTDKVLLPTLRLRKLIYEM